MTVATSQRRVPYVLDGVTTAFPVPFPFPAATDLQVVRTTLAGVDVPLALNVDYAVAGAGNPAGGTVTLNSGFGVGERLTIKRSVARTQLTDYVPNDPFPAEAHEAALDKLTMIAQEDGDELARALVVPDTDTARGQMQLPSVTARADRVLGFNGAGLPVPGPLTSQVQQLVDTAFTPGISGVSDGVSHGRPGGITRTVGSKLRDRFDLRDFGVRSRHETSNEYTAEIQAALDQAKSEKITAVFCDEPYWTAGTLVQPASVAVMSSAGVSRWFEGSPANEDPGPGFYKPSDGLDGCLLIRGVGAHLIGITLDHQKVGGATPFFGGVMQMGPGSNTATFNNTLTMNVHIRGHEMNELTGLRRGTVNFDGPFGVAGTDCTLVMFPGSTLGSQRYWHQFINPYLENGRRGFFFNDQSNGIFVSGFRFRTVWRPVWMKGGGFECIENIIDGVWAQNYALPTPTLNGGQVAALPENDENIAQADMALITMEDTCRFHQFRGPTEGGGRLWYLSPTSAAAFNDASGLINNERFTAPMPPGWALPRNEFDAGRRSLGGKREKFIPFNFTDINNASQGHGSRIEWDHVQLTGLPLLNGPANIPDPIGQPALYAQWLAATRIMTKWTLPETVAKAAAPHICLTSTYTVHAPGAGAGSHSTEIDWEYRVANNDGAAGELRIKAVRQFPPVGNYVIGCRLITGETGGSRPFAIALTLGNLGATTPTQVSQSHIGKIESTNATPRPMVEFGDIDFTPTAPTANDVADSLPMLAEWTFAV